MTALFNDNETAVFRNIGEHFGGKRHDKLHVFFFCDAGSRNYPRPLGGQLVVIGTKRGVYRLTPMPKRDWACVQLHRDHADDILQKQMVGRVWFEKNELLCGDREAVAIVHLGEFEFTFHIFQPNEVGVHVYPPPSGISL